MMAGTGGNGGAGLPACRADIEALIPHRGAMCLLERVVAFDERQVIAATRTHRSADNPLRRNGRLHALHLCEYGAQAAAVHGGLLARAGVGEARPGLLAAMRDVRLACAELTVLEDELWVQATLLIEDGGGCQYAFAVEHAGGEIACGRVAIIRRGSGRPAPPTPDEAEQGRRGASAVTPRPAGR